jgi:oligoendopeptidase F
MSFGPVQARWSLHELLPGPADPAVEGYLARLETIVAEIEATRGTLSPSPSVTEFLNLLQRFEAATSILARLGAYAYLWFAEDTQNTAALDMRGRIEQVLAQMSNRILFFSLWFKALPDDAASRLIAASGRMHYYLESLRRFTPHTLSEPEEKIITLKDINGIEALVKIYEMITSRFSFTIDVQGEKKTLTRDGVTALYRHPSPEVRAGAYREIFRVYGENATVLAQIYMHRVRDWRTEALELRGYREAIAARNLANDIPDAAVDTLLTVCRQNVGVFQRYFSLKARWLGVDRLRRYDVYAPLASSDKHYEYAEAVELTLSSLRGFAPLLADAAERVFAQEHVDSQMRHGKRGGAFCYGVLPELAPWVLVNYAGRARDVTTLAHEIGHAVHSTMAAGQSILTYHPSTPLAETASVFSEMLLTDRLLRDERDPMVRREILARAVDDAYATVLRQAYFTLFERDAHRMIAESRPVESLCAHYLENLREQFGEAIALSDDFSWEWITIPHIYNSPFYTYSYSFGQLLVLALYSRYRVEGASFVPKYLQILAYGGSEAPATILSEAGLDISSPSFWQGGFDVLRGMIEELEAIG